MAAEQARTKPPSAQSELVYLEAGRLTAAKVLALGPKNCQIEEAGGGSRRIATRKVMAYAGPGEAAGLAAAAARLSGELSVEELWRAAAGAELGVEELAKLLPAGAPPPVQSAALQLALLRQGGFFEPAGENWKPVAPERFEQVRRSHARRIERQRREERYHAELAAGRLPAELAEALRGHFAGREEPNDPDVRFVSSWTAKNGSSWAELAHRHGIIADYVESHMLEVRRRQPPATAEDEEPPAPPDLADAPLIANGIAIDAGGTVEVDDAFAWDPAARRFYVCIAAPALGLGAAARRQAAERMLTLYLPGEKHTMLPRRAIEAYSLDAGAARPCVALAIDVDDKGAVRGREFMLARIKVAANLPLEDCAAPDAAALPVAAELKEPLAALLRLAEQVANFPRRQRQRGHLVMRAGGRTRICPRADLALLDDLVADLMIYYNTAAASYLNERGHPFICRREGRSALGGGRAGGKKGFAYGWFSSPLRRLVDLWNQEQLLAALKGERPPRGPKELRGLISEFERRFQWTQRQQQKLEKYWTIRWLQEQAERSWAAVPLPDEPSRVLLEEIGLHAELAGAAPAADEKLQVVPTACDPVGLRVEVRRA
ncbi:MAG: RNB domain-containing ribonuclease [Betaproteobacteria bacterium AqS2]|uniref:RNB domain-containing ribonuclease n=1 Tax=Candidatus Amphirhobacter heronislandensis TaxID=1732024 RepID=A0A930Y0X9_9GAMM|nr:RNB domain-containing ribonuclease [Betaproteobacteria bacterium AqS2]